MDSLSQEIIDEIIDNLPRFHLHSSALVARRWCRRSQKRAFFSTVFCSQYKVNDLYMCTHNDPDGIASLVQVARFGQIVRWRDPGLLGRVLENFNSLYVSSTVLPDEMLKQISHEGFGKTITTFHLLFSWYSLSMLMSLITAFTSLQDLLVRTHASKAVESPSVCSVLPRREPLDSLEVVPC